MVFPVFRDLGAHFFWGGAFLNHFWHTVGRQPMGVPGVYTSSSWWGSYLGHETSGGVDSNFPLAKGVTLWGAPRDLEGVAGHFLRGVYLRSERAWCI